MTSLGHRHATFVDASTFQAAQRWSALLDAQIDLFFPTEAKFLRSLATWRGARSIADVGCGNGTYLWRLRAAFPDKLYTGMDISPELIAIAAAKYRGELRFVVRNFFDPVDGSPVDFLVMRFLIQHLGDLQPVLQSAHAMLRPRGALLVIEPCLAHSRNLPDTPLLYDLFTRFELSRGAHGYLRGRLTDIPRIAVSTGAWEVSASEIICVRQQGPFADSLTIQLYHQWIDLCQESGLFSFPFDDVRAEVDRWAPNGASSCIALRAIVLERLDDVDVSPDQRRFPRTQ